MARSALINVMVQAARKAGRVLSRDFGEVSNLQVSRKGPADFVTAADRRAEQILIDALQRARPGYAILSEEAGVISGTDASHRWIIDPLDGTTNFVHAIPLFAISIGLERDGRLVAALVYNPITDELFTAERGAGAFLNDHRLRVAARRDLGECVVITGIPHMGRGDHRLSLAELELLMPRVAGIRRMGSAALDLAFIAAGRGDGFWEHGLQAWDMAAGILLVREAGGFVTDMSGRDKMFDTGSIIAANADIHAELLSTLKQSSVSS